jgi:hypothetical protein
VDERNIRLRSQAKCRPAHDVLPRHQRFTDSRRVSQVSEEIDDGDGRSDKEGRKQSGGVSGGYGDRIEATLSGGAALANIKSYEVAEVSPGYRDHADVGEPRTAGHRAEEAEDEGNRHEDDRFPDFP